MSFPRQSYSTNINVSQLNSSNNMTSLGEKNSSSYSPSKNNDFVSYITELDKKYSKLNYRTKELSNKLNQMTCSSPQQKINIEKISELENTCSKLTNKTTTHEIRIGQISKEVSDFCFKYEKMLKESFNFPGIVGPFCKYKSISDFITYLNDQCSILIAFKEKCILDFESYQKKADGLFQSINYKLENYTKNQVSACNQILQDAKNNVCSNLQDVNSKFLELHAELTNKTNTLRKELIQMIDRVENKTFINSNSLPENQQIMNNSNSSNFILVNNNTTNNNENLLEEIKHLKEQIVSIKTTLEEKIKDNTSSNKRVRNLSEKQTTHITNLSTLKNGKTKIILSSNPSKGNIKSRNNESNRKVLKGSSTFSTDELAKINSSFLKKSMKKNLSHSNINGLTKSKSKLKELVHKSQEENETLKNLDINKLTSSISNSNYENIQCFTDYQDEFKTKSLFSLKKKPKLILEENETINDSSNVRSDCSSTSNKNSNSKVQINPIQAMQFANKDNIELLTFNSAKKSISQSPEISSKVEIIRDNRNIFGTVKVSKVFSLKRNSKEKIPIDCSPCSPMNQSNKKNC